MNIVQAVKELKHYKKITRGLTPIHIYEMRVIEGDGGDHCLIGRERFCPHCSQRQIAGVDQQGHTVYGNGQIVLEECTPTVDDILAKDWRVITPEEEQTWHPRKQC